MIKHSIYLATLACLAACGSPEARPAQRDIRVVTGAQARGEAARAWAADAASTPLAPGAWRANADETLAEFVGAGASLPGFTFGCTRGFLQFERLFSRPHGLDPRQGEPFTVLTTREIIAYTATVGGERDSVRLWFAAGASDFRLDEMVANENGFAFQTVGEVTRFAHDPLLARVLANCRARGNDR